MKNITGSDRRMAQDDDQKRPDAAPEREDIRGVEGDADEFDDADDDDDDEEEDDEEGSL
jgi:hypothetical protein